jgi:type I restriction enzyme R subunit
MRAHLEAAFEDSIEEYLLEQGWLPSAPVHYNRELGLDTAELYAFLGATQADAWERLIGLHGGQERAQQKFARRLADELTVRGAVDVLRRGVKDLGVQIDLAYFAPAHDLTPELRVLYEANRVTVTRQAPVSESHPLDTVDLLLGINGIPVATAELKTQTAGQRVDDAIRQYRRDRNPADLIFRSRTVVHFAVDQDQVYMTTRLAGRDTVFLPFNQGSAGPGRDGGKGNPVNPTGARTAYLWEQVWDRDAWLDLIGSFVHVEHERDATGKKTGKTVTIFPRYHQWDAVTKLLATARAQGPGQNKLIQHSAGSGKSNTIAWLAHRLSRLHTPGDLAQLGEGAHAAGLGPNTPVFDKVVVVTDRVVLDRQLQETVASFEHTPGMIVKIDRDSQQLRAALEGKQARIIITTLQKFPVVAQGATELAGTRFAVIVDEAHSSQSGEAAKDLKAVLSGKTGEQALAAAEDADAATEAAERDVEDLLAESVAARGRQPNLTFFAFTATPKHKTLSLFGERLLDAAGEERHVPFHLYSMRQAIEEGFILDVLANYTTYATYYRLANGLGPGEDPQLPKGKAASALARWVSLHPTNIKQRAEVIVEHFRHHTATRIGGQAKAMVVTASRLHAVRYWQKINEVIAEKGYDTGEHPVRALVAFSGTVTDPDNATVEYREGMLNGFGEAELPERFAGDEFNVLVVAEKYQTGFDQPLLHTMYVAKKLAEVKAVQTLSRLNRTHPGKDDTFVLDFVNDAEDIREAFRPYFTETTAAPTDPNLLYNLQRRILGAGIIDPAEMAAGVEAILRGGAAGSATLNAAIDPAVERWHTLDDDAAREDVRTALRDYTRASAFLAQIVPFADTELEALYYYGKFLLTRLPRPGDGGGVDVDGAVVLTHLRTNLIAEHADLSLTDGGDEPLTGPGEGRGRQHEQPTEPLSALIAALNERFGMDLTDADRIWFEQQEAHLRADDDVRVVALNNDFQQFKVFLEPRVEDKIVDRQQANDTLFQAYFDKPEFRDLMVDWLTKTLYDGIRGDEGRTA